MILHRGRGVPQLWSNFFVLAELIATFLLVFVSCGAGAMSERDAHLVSKLGASLAGGLMVTVLIYAIAHISGAHMNPAVTLAFAATWHFPWIQVGELGGVAVGAVVSIAAVFAGPISGGSMNPARTLGPALASKKNNGLWVYFVGPILGTLFGAWFYNFVRLPDDNNSVCQRQSTFRIQRTQCHENAYYTHNADPTEPA